MSSPTLAEKGPCTSYSALETDTPTSKLTAPELKVKADALATRIKDMKQALQDLEEQYADCLKQMGGPSSLLPAVARVPFDVLSSIFQLVQEASNEPISPTHPSCILSQVCRDWRGVALDSPSLWADMRITIPTYGVRAFDEDGAEREFRWVEMMKDLTNCVDMWTSRSRSSPVTMLAKSDPTQRSWSSARCAALNSLYKKLAEAIKQSSSRWKRVSLSLNIELFSESLIDLLIHSPHTLPILEAAELRIAHHNSFQENTVSRRLHKVFTSPGILSAHSLRHIKLGGTLGDVSSSAVTKHWPELATLDFEAYQEAHDTPLDFYVNQILQILGALPTLVRVIFHNYGYATLIPVLPIPITSPCLRSLTLTGADIPRGFAQSLHLPSLRELRITPSQTPHTRDVGSGVGEFLLRFGAYLDSLSFAPDVFSHRTLVAIYEALLSLENLSLVPFNTAGPYLHRSVRQPGVDCYALRELNGVAPGAYLGPTAGGSSRCPRLRRLELQGTMDTYIDDAVERELVDLIIDRRRRSGAGGDTILEGVFVAFQKAWRPEGLNVLTELTEHGVDLDGFRLELTYRDSHRISYP